MSAIAASLGGSGFLFVILFPIFTISNLALITFGIFLKPIDYLFELAHKIINKELIQYEELCENELISNNKIPTNAMIKLIERYNTFLFESKSDLSLKFLMNFNTIDVGEFIKKYHLYDKNNIQHLNQKLIDFLDKYDLQKDVGMQNHFILNNTTRIQKIQDMFWYMENNIELFNSKENIVNNEHIENNLSLFIKSHNEYKNIQLSIKNENFKTIEKLNNEFNKLSIQYNNVSKMNFYSAIIINLNKNISNIKAKNPQINGEQLNFIFTFNMENNLKDEFDRLEKEIENYYTKINELN